MLLAGRPVSFPLFKSEAGEWGSALGPHVILARILLAVVFPFLLDVLQGMLTSDILNFTYVLVIIRKL